MTEFVCNDEVQMSTKVLLFKANNEQNLCIDSKCKEQKSSKEQKNLQRK